MSRGTTKALIRSTMLYMLFALIMGWLILLNEFKMGDLGNFLPMSEYIAALSLDLILIPLIAAVTVFYLASVVNLTYEGVLVETLVGTLYAAGFAIFFALFLILNPNPKINSSGYLITAAFTVILAYNVVATYARLRNMPPLKAIAISVVIYTEGQIVVRLVSILIESSGATMPPELMTAVNEFISLGVTIAAIFTVFAVFKTSENSYLSALGGISGNYIFSVSLSLIGALYYGFFLGGLQSFAPGLSNLSPYVEWTGICVFAALIFTVMRKGMQGSIMIRDRLGDWRKHMQRVTTYKGDRFVGFTEIIDEFVERGNRDRLLVKLALFLHENDVSDDDISGALGELINYEDEKKPSFSRRGQGQLIENKNIERRLAVLQSTIGNIVPEEGPLNPGAPAVSEGVGQEVTI